MQRLTMMTWVNRIPTLVLFHWSILLNRLVYRKALQEWSNAIDHLMTFLLDWYCLPVRVIDCNAVWLMQHTIDDRPWNPRNPNSMLRNIASHHVPHLVRDSLVVFVSKKFCCRGGAKGRSGNGLVIPFKLLNVFTSSRVRAAIFFAPRRGETPGTDQTC